MSERTLKIRQYKPQDKQAVKELNYAGVAQINGLGNMDMPPDIDDICADLDDIEGTYLNNNGEFLVGSEDGQVVAMGALMKYSDSCGEIKRIRVRRDCQRRGYAETIMRKLTETAKKLGYREVRLDTVVFNKPAQQLVNKMGFIKTHPGKIGPYDVQYYRKDI